MSIDLAQCHKLLNDSLELTLLLDYKALFIFHSNLNNTLSFAFSIYSVFPPVSSV